MPALFDDEIAGLLRAHRPRSLLAVVAGAAVPGLAAYRAAGGDIQVTSLPPGRAMETLNDLGRFDAALLAGALEVLGKAAGNRLIASLRDVHAAHLYVAAPAGVGEDRWTDEEMRALGLTLVARDDRRRLCLHQFDIAAYKQTPDWLNADHWANPQLWDKYRW